MGQMLYIVWNNKNNTGIPIIDEQHRGIVSTINSLHYLVNEGLGKEAIKHILSMLEQYIHIHFKIEQAIIRNSGYPDYREHVKLHDELARKTKDFLAANIDDEQIILRFLKEWWLNHINVEDMKYVPHVKQYLNL